VAKAQLNHVPTTLQVSIPEPPSGHDHLSASI
jgi:hypothetical protein